MRVHASSLEQALQSGVMGVRRHCAQEGCTFDHGQVFDQNRQAPEVAFRHLIWVLAQVRQLGAQRLRALAGLLEKSKLLRDGIYAMVCYSKPRL